MVGIIIPRQALDAKPQGSPPGFHPNMNRIISLWSPLFLKDKGPWPFGGGPRDTLIGLICMSPPIKVKPPLTNLSFLCPRKYTRRPGHKPRKCPKQSPPLKRRAYQTGFIPPSKGGECSMITELTSESLAHQARLVILNYK